MQDRAPQPRPESKEAYPDMETKLPASAAIKETLVRAIDSHLDPEDPEADTALFRTNTDQMVFLQHHSDDTRAVVFRGKRIERKLVIDTQGSIEEQGGAPAPDTRYFSIPAEDGYEATRQDVEDASKSESDAPGEDLNHKEAKELLDSIATLKLVKKFKAQDSSEAQ